MLAVAVPLHDAVSYVAGAYVTFFAIVLVYVAIMATKLGRVERELAQLNERLAAADDEEVASELDAAGRDELAAVGGERR